MVELNILRERVRRFQQRAVALRVVAVYLAGLVFMGIIFGIIYFAGTIEMNSIQRQIRHTQQKMEQQTNLLGQLKRYREDGRALLEELSYCREEVGKRVLLAGRLAFVGRCLPPEVRLERILWADRSDAQQRKTLFVIEGHTPPALETARAALLRFVENLCAGVHREFSTVEIQEMKKEGTDAESQRYFFRIVCNLPSAPVGKAQP